MLSSPLSGLFGHVACSHFLFLACILVKFRQREKNGCVSASQPAAWLLGFHTHSVQLLRQRQGIVYFPYRCFCAALKWKLLYWLPLHYLFCRGGEYLVRWPELVGPFSWPCLQTSSAGCRRTVPGAWQDPTPQFLLHAYSPARARATRVINMPFLAVEKRVASRILFSVFSKNP